VISGCSRRVSFVLSPRQIANDVDREISSDHVPSRDCVLSIALEFRACVSIVLRRGKRRMRREEEISETRIGKGWREGITGQKPSNLTETRSSVLRGTWREPPRLPLEEAVSFLSFPFFSFFSCVVPDAERKRGKRE